MEKIDVYAICEKIMRAATIETFRPFATKDGKFLMEKFARSKVDGFTERLFDGCRKVNKKTCENSLKVKSLSLYIKALNDTGKLTNGYEIGFKSLVNMFISWTDGKFTFNLKEEADLKTIGNAIAFASLSGYVPDGKMLVVVKNRDGVNVARLVDFQSGFYSWKETAAKKESDTVTYNYEQLIDFLKIADAGLLLGLSNDLAAILKDRGIIRVRKAA